MSGVGEEERRGTTTAGPRPSMRDVARAAGVSLSSVSLVAAGRPGVGEETRARTLEVMRQMGYTPRARRDGSRQARTRCTLAIISERLTQPIERDVFYAEILQGIQTEAQRHGHRV